MTDLRATMEDQKRECDRQKTEIVADIDLMATQHLEALKATRKATHDYEVQLRRTQNNLEVEQNSILNLSKESTE